MNRSFENIFEKYNISCEVPKKRYKSPNSLPKSLVLHKKALNLNIGSTNLPKIEKENLLSCSAPNTRRSLNFNSKCYINTNTKGKYYNPTRYKTLEIIGVENVSKRQTFEEKPNESDGESSSKEKYNEKPSYGFNKLDSFEKFGTDLNIRETNDGDCSQIEMNLYSDGSVHNFNKNNSSDSLNIRKSKSLGLFYKPLNVTPLTKRNNLNNLFENQPKSKCVSMIGSNISLSDSLQTFESNSRQPSENKNPRITTTQPVENSSSELDLLIELIQQEEKNNKKLLAHKQTAKFLNCDDSTPCSKSCLKGGYQELFQRALKHEKVKSNFLKYDKKIALRTGQLLTVLKIETSYGLTLATVKNKDLNTTFAIVIAQEMAPRLKIGAQIESFFDDKTVPYKLQLTGESLDVYLEPYKLLIV